MGAGTAAPWGYTNNGCGPTAEGRNLTEKRPFGKTGVELPILSLGCQQLVDEEGCSQDQAVAILEQALIEARDEGLVRFISISGHANPQLLLEAIRRFPFDTALCAVSALDHFIYSFAEEFLPFALQKCMGVVGMKVLGYKALAADWQRALRYGMGLPLTTVITGCSTIEQLNGNIDLAENFVPMTSVERLAFFRDILPMVTPQNMPWKSRDSARKDWIERKELFGLTRTGCQ
jgi:uncharacterized protein